MIKIIVLSIICESVWQTLKLTWQKDKYLTMDNAGAIIVGLVIAFTTNLDILSIVGIESEIPYIGVVLTGILLSRGSNFIHDLLIKIQSTTSSLESSIIEKQSYYGHDALTNDSHSISDDSKESEK